MGAMSQRRRTLHPNHYEYPSATVNLQVCVQPRSSAVNVTLPSPATKRRAAAQLLLCARRSPLSVDISCPHSAQQQTRHTPMLLSNDGTDSRTDGRSTVS